MKLFGKNGKLNLVDLVIVLVLVAAVVFVALRFFSDKTETLGSENTLSAPNLRFDVVCEDVAPELKDNLILALSGETQNIGGNTVAMTRLFNSNKLVDAQIVETADTANEDGTVNVRFTVEAAAVISNGAYSVGTQEVRVGKEFNVKTLNIEIKGVVFAMEKLDE